MNKAFRQAQIAKLVRVGQIRTQEELAAGLAALDIETTQATLSRDIRELGIIKTPEGYRQRAAVTASRSHREDLRRVFQEFLRDIQLAQNLVVLKTDPGGAMAVGQVLDTEGDLGITGTVAGDDTIFAATGSSAAAKTLRDKLLALWR